MSGSRQVNRWLWTAASLLIIIIGGFAAWLGFQTNETWQRLGGKLAPDGNLEVLTLIPEQAIRIVLFVLAAIFLGLGIAMVLRPEWLSRSLQAVWNSASSLVKRFPYDFKTFFRDLHGWPHSRVDSWIILIFLALSILLRVPLLDRPVIHDEAYTAVTWAPGPLSYIVEDYHLPNNHIFHTVLVSLPYDLFGSQPWSIRLPAFLAGLLLIPASYGLARRWYGRAPALTTAGLIALAPIITDYATIARGYSLFMLFSVMVFWLAARLVRQNNLIEWLLLAVFGALGFWTVPMMVYPFGAMCVWMALSAVFGSKVKQAYGSSLRLIKYLVVTGIITLILTGFLYLPVLLYSGPDPLFNNPFIFPLSFAEFWPTLFESRLPETFVEWTRGFGLFGTVLLTVGVFLSLIFHKQSSHFPVHALWANLLWLTPVLLLRRPNAWARTWSFLYPLGYIWAAAGWAVLVSRINLNGKSKERWRWGFRGAVGLILIAGLALSFNHSRQICPQIACPPGDEESVVMYLSTRLEKTDLVLVESPSNAVVWYYFEQYGLSRDHFRKDLPFYKAYILILTTEDQTVESVINHFGFSVDWFEMETLTLVHTAGQTQVYQLEANKERVNQEYGIE